METQDKNTEVYDKLQDILKLRTYFMCKRWNETLVTKFKTKVDVSFYNNQSDFRETAYPNVDIAIQDQVKKLHRDIRSSVGTQRYELLKELIND